MADCEFLVRGRDPLASGHWLEGLTDVGFAGLALALFELTNFRKR